MIDDTPLTDSTPAQQTAVVGYTASGSSQLEAVAITGAYEFSPGQTQNGFSPSWAASANPPHIPSHFSYTADGMSHTNLTAVSAIAVTMRIQTAINPDVFQDQGALLVQMSNGDMFFRPLNAQLPNWAGITQVHSIQVISVSIGTSFSAFNHTTSFAPSIFDVEFPCFTRGTLIETDQGLIPVESLKVGDLVRTADHGFKPIVWIGSRSLDRVDLAARPKLRPIEIKAGALGPGLPLRDLVVSPQHRVLVKSRIVQRLFAQDEVLVAAIHLVGSAGIQRLNDCNQVEYFHFMLDQHEVVFAEGAPTESLYLGKQAAKMLPTSCMDEILTLFPDLHPGEGVPARTFVTGKQGREIATKHISQGQALLPALRN
ncbi:Hint domain-containing protein [Paracoccus aminophilus]|nr:Hint domain-containing protein [Paracoccus aminophilus]